MTLDNLLTLTNTIISTGVKTDGMGVTLTLDKKEHKSLDLELFKYANSTSVGYKHNEIIEINLGGISYYIDYD